MDLAKLKQLINDANGEPVIIFIDNLVFFEVNMEDNFLFEKDGLLYHVKPNLNDPPYQVNQNYCPWIVRVFEAEDVQRVYYYKTRDKMKTYINSLTQPLGKWTTDDFKKTVLTSKIMTANTPIGYNETLNKDQIESAGVSQRVTLNGTVYLGKDVPDFEKKLMED